MKRYLRRSPFVLLAAVTAVAADYSRDYRLCLDRSAGATSVVLSCMEREIARQSRGMDRAFRRIMAALPPERRNLLLWSQRYWRRYRDTRCALLYHRQSGSGGLEDQLQCLLDETVRRRRELTAESPTADHGVGNAESLRQPPENVAGGLHRLGPNGESLLVPEKRGVQIPRTVTSSRR